MSGALRIRRIRVTDFRGIAEREIRFAETGVTVVEGPNESGKSSLADALDLLIEYKDSSKHRDVLAAQPVGTDAGPLVEADLLVGPYSITYRKRWVRDRETRIVVQGPRPEILTGDAAHDRALEILDANADRALWRALRLLQGRDVGQASVKAAGSLGAALERAAGGTDPAEEGSLFESVEAEAARYYTPTGREKDVFAPLGDAVATATATVRRLRAECDRVEADAEALARITAELAGMHESLAAADVATKEREARWARVEKLAGVSRERRAAHEAATARANEVRAAAEARRALSASALEAEQELAVLVAPGTVEEGRQGELDRSLAATVARVADARRARDGAVHTVAIRRGDRDALRDRAELAALQARKHRLDALAEAGRVAQAAVETNPITDGILDGIEGATRAAELARARLDAGAGEVTIEATSPIEPVIDGAVVRIAAGRIETRSIGEGLRIEVPGVVRLVARPGASAAGLRADLEAAEAALARAFGEAGVADVVAARARSAERRSAAEAVTRARREFAAVLAGERQADLEQRIATLAARQADRASTERERPPDLAGPRDADEASTLLDAAEDADRAATTALGIAEEAERSAHIAADTARAASEERRVAVGIAERRARDLAETLAVARDAAVDDVLERRLADAERDAAEAGASRLRAETELAEANPEQAKALAENARKALDGLRARQHQLSVDQARLAGALEQRGEAGLSEQLDTAEGELVRAEDALRRLRRRAAAARLLLDTVKARRAEAFRRYVLPLKQRLEALGRLVFGPDVIVDVADDLSIASLARGGAPIAWEQLSIGTREQLGVLVRLACAELVAADGGVPVMLDDALGWSDPQRLEAMGAVLARAGETAQVIVLTCFPDRYVHVGGATVLRLE